MPPAEWLKHGVGSPEMLAYLWLALENRRTMVVCGPSESGKTTTWDILCQFVPPRFRTERIEARDGEDLPAQMRAALEKKPDYLLVQEVQGEAAHLAFQAMNEGHGVLTVVQFPDVKAMVNGLEEPPASIPRALFTALNILVLQNPVTVGGSKTRRVTKVVEFVAYEEKTNEIITNQAYGWDAGTDSFEPAEHSFVLEVLAETKKVTLGEIDADLKGRTEVLADMLANGITDPAEVARILGAYPPGG